MIYYRDNGNEREKYEVTFDWERMQQLERTVATKCGEHRIVHEEIGRDDVPMNDFFTWNHESYHYRNGVGYSKSGNTKMECDHYDRYEVDLYNCTYNDYICPEFVRFIGKVIRKEPEAIERVFNRDLNEYTVFPKVKEKIALLQEEIAALSRNYVSNRKKKATEMRQSYEELNQKTGNLEEQIKTLQSWSTKTEKELLDMDKEYATKAKELNDKLKYLLSIEKLNENQEDVSKYIDELLNIVEIRLVDVISLDLINRVESFQSDEVPTKEAQLVKQK